MWRTLLPILLIVGLWLAPPAQAEVREGFESPEPSWQFAEADCTARVLKQQRVFQNAHSGNGCEHLQIQAGFGTFVYFSHRAGRAPVIAELVPSVWVRSDRSGLQLLARIILPRSKHPKSGQPLTALISGESYTNVGGWQSLTVPNLPQQLERHVRVLRQQFGRDVDAREAFLDLVVLNAYGGSGVTNVWLDDLELAGHIASQTYLDESRNPLGGVRPVAFNQPVSGPSEAAAVGRISNPSPASMGRIGNPSYVAPTQNEHARLDGSVLFFRGRPFQARIIEHNGEPFEWLQSLGFNVVKLPQTPSPLQLEEALRLNLWLIAPPPQTLGGMAISPTFDPVLAWSLGTKLADREFDATRQFAEETRKADVRRRPLVCQAEARLWSYSQFADLLLLDRPTLGTSFELDDYAAWLRERPRFARLGTPCWAAIPTEPRDELARQLTILNGPSSPSGNRPLPAVEAAQIRLLTYAAVSAGARGLLFKSRTRLDATVENRLRAATLHLLNLELQLIEPWVAAGSYAEEIDAENQPVRISALQTERARLLVVTRTGAEQQFAVRPAEKENLTFVVPGTASSADAYEVTLAGLQPLRRRRTAGGLRVTLEHVGPTALVVFTQDPLVISHLGRTLAEIRLPAAQRRHEIAVGEQAMVRATHAQLVDRAHGEKDAADWLRQAETNLSQAQRSLEAKDFQQVHVFADRAETFLAKTRRRSWDQVARTFPSPVASPFCASFATLPDHWAMADRLRGVRWSANQLPGGDFEDLQQLLSFGWRQHRREEQKGIEVGVELSPQSPQAGRTSLHLTAAATNSASPPDVEAPPVWITSSPLPVREGQLLRLHGFANVPRSIRGSREGLLIFDSFSGPALGERVQQTDGWREFTHYRAATQTGELILTFALTGLGEAWVDTVSVEVVDGQR